MTWQYLNLRTNFRIWETGSSEMAEQLEEALGREIAAIVMGQINPLRHEWLEGRQVEPKLFFVPDRLILH